MQLLEVRELRRRYGDLTVLDGVSFTLQAGQIGVVVGPNGAGKSTLLRCVVGADRPDEGELTIDGRQYWETDAWFRALVAAALDDLDFFPDLSVAEHLELLAFAHGGAAEPGAEPGAEPVGSAEPVDQVLAELRIDHVRDQLPGSLSSGQRRRLALASCFVRPRRLLVLDEPEQRLDVGGREWVSERLLREKASGTAVLLATHDHLLAEAVADTTISLGD